VICNCIIHAATAVILTDNLCLCYGVFTLSGLAWNLLNW
jgi:hypothetical protein